MRDFEERIKEARARWGLTVRQAEVLSRLAMGDANKEIAAHFGIGVRTVEKHVATIMTNADVESRLRLVAAFWCIRREHAPVG